MKVIIKKGDFVNYNRNWKDDPLTIMDQYGKDAKQAFFESLKNMKKNNIEKIYLENSQLQLVISIFSEEEKKSLNTSFDGKLELNPYKKNSDTCLNHYQHYFFNIEENNNDIVEYISLYCLNNEIEKRTDWLVDYITNSCGESNDYNVINETLDDLLQWFTLKEIYDLLINNDKNNNSVKLLLLELTNRQK